VNATMTFLIISTVVTGIIGLPLILFAVGFTDFSGKAATAVIGVFLIITGILQRKAAGREELLKRIGNTDSFITGIAQGFSALPGISRSGITVSALLLRKFDAERALRLSFLMSIPAVLAAEVGLLLMDMIVFDINSLAAIVSSFVFGLLTISALFRVAKKIDFSWFCIVLGILSITVFFI
ncbi:MAG: undecaprenyl-diphosphate phosphatase, partial [Candidatus Aenigmarchaeota archaeon]|nr:undecaprenyl-diphosphate phosphatase [Candidatus Aenigmarchaeota archaeon]